MMRSFCVGEVVDRLPAGAAMMVGTEVLEGVTCRVGAASGAAVDG